MKKLILVFAALAVTAGTYAQVDSTNKKMNQWDKNNKQNQNMQNQTVDKSHKDGLVMQNGKIMQMKNGQTTLLERDMTMSNGTKITTDGTCIKKDGTKTTLKEGQQVDMSGNMITNKDNDTYILPDSTRKNNNK